MFLKSQTFGLKCEGIWLVFLQRWSPKSCSRIDGLMNWLEYAASLKYAALWRTFSMNDGKIVIFIGRKKRWDPLRFHCCFFCDDCCFIVFFFRKCQSSVFICPHDLWNPTSCPLLPGTRLQPSSQMSFVDYIMDKYPFHVYFFQLGSNDCVRRPQSTWDTTYTLSEIKRWHRRFKIEILTQTFLSMCSYLELAGQWAELFFQTNKQRAALGLDCQYF